MKEDIIILIAEDDDGHAALVQRNLKRSGIANKMVRFRNGQEVLDYLIKDDDVEQSPKGIPYLLLLDIRMPKIDGIEVLRTLKSHPVLKKMPVIMVTTTDDPREVNRCHELGCNNYVIKPVDYDKFVDAIKQLGLFLKVVRVPDLNERLNIESEQ